MYAILRFASLINLSAVMKLHYFKPDAVMKTIVIIKKKDCSPRSSPGVL